MDRVWFSRGLQGMIARRVQSDLLRNGFADGAAASFVDGDFGGRTEQALKRLQHARALAETGAVDTASWQQLTDDPLPSLFERCIGLTARFEGHGFTLLQGNFDGAGLTWGIIGYTLSNGEIQRVLAEAEAASAGTLDRLMGPLAAVWRQVTARPLAQQVAWADSISSGPSKTLVPAAWKAAFERLGNDPLVQHGQLQKAYDDYFVPAAATSRRVGLVSELGVALCFDMHVQNGSSRVKAVEQIAAAPAMPPERLRREALANAVAEFSSAPWRENVRRRKLAIATGAGTVNGSAFRLPAWGLDEVPAA